MARENLSGQLNLTPSCRFRPVDCRCLVGRPADRLDQCFQKFCWIRSDRLTDGHEFDDIDAALPAFIFGDKRLRFVKSLGKFVLGQPSALSRLNHKLGKGALAFRMDRFVKFSRASSHLKWTPEIGPNVKV